MTKKLEELSKEELMKLLVSANKKLKKKDEIIKNKCHDIKEQDKVLDFARQKLNELQAAMIEADKDIRNLLFSALVYNARLSANNIPVDVSPSKLLTDVIQECPMEAIPIHARKFELHSSGFPNPSLDHMTKLELTMSLLAAHNKIAKLKKKLKRKAASIVELEQEINTVVVPTVGKMKAELIHTLQYVNKLKKKLEYHRIELPHHTAFEIISMATAGEKEGEDILANLRQYVEERETI